MGHDEDGPLKPTYNHERPPWIGLYSKREYKKQPEWWAEAGMKNKSMRSHQFVLAHPTVKEEDTDFFDPPVEDGKSISGPFGLDSTSVKNLTYKADTPGDLKEFQRKVMEGSLQYKQIAEKYNLSPEHPGLAVNPTMQRLPLVNLDRIGIGALTPTSWQHLGPRFFNKPLNEGCFEKAAAAAKYAAFFTLPITMFEIKAHQSVPVKEFSGMRFVRRYFQLLPFPVAFASTWAVSICAASAIRNKDDVTNHLIAGPVTGAFVATVRNNIVWGVATAIIVTLFGVTWQYQRLSEKGLQGRAVPEMVSGFHGGPNHWKMLTYGSYKTPEANF